MNELIEIEEKNLMQVFSDENGLDHVVEQAKEIVDSFEHDLSTKAGRQKTASLARKISSLKTRVDGLGKDLVSDWKKKAKAVDDNRKDLREKLDSLRDEARKPLTDWENAEKKRVDDIRAEIKFISDLAAIDDEANSDQIAEKLSVLKKKTIDESYDEFQEEALRNLWTLIESLEKQYVIVKKQEEQQAEIDRLKKEQAEREAKEQADRLREQQEKRAKDRAERDYKEKQERAEREKIEAQTREKMALEQAERAEAARIESERLAKIRQKEAEEAAKQREIDRQEREREEAEKKKEAILADRERCKAVRINILNQLMEIGLSVDDAKVVIKAVHNKYIDGLSINYY